MTHGRWRGTTILQLATAINSGYLTKSGKKVDEINRQLAVHSFSRVAGSASTLILMRVPWKTFWQYLCNHFSCQKQPKDQQTLTPQL
jgi:hypothetical protein